MYHHEYIYIGMTISLDFKLHTCVIGFLFRKITYGQYNR